MHYSEIKKQLASIINSSSWEQTLFAISQLAVDKEDELDKSEESFEASKYSKLADTLHDLSNLVG